MSGGRIREDDYRAMYAPLISLISEQCAHAGALEMAIDIERQEYRFVVALTFEQLNAHRTRRLRAMVMYEPMLLTLPDDCPEVEREESKTRYQTLLAIKRQYQTNPERFGVFKIWI